MQVEPESRFWSLRVLPVQFLASMQRKAKQVVNLTWTFLLLAFCTGLFPSTLIRPGKRRTTQVPGTGGGDEHWLRMLLFLLYRDPASLAKSGRLSLSYCIARPIENADERAKDDNHDHNPLVGYFATLATGTRKLHGQSSCVRNQSLF